MKKGREWNNIGRDLLYSIFLTKEDQLDFKISIYLWCSLLKLDSFVNITLVLSDLSRRGDNVSVNSVRENEKGNESRETAKNNGKENVNYIITSISNNSSSNSSRGGRLNVPMTIGQTLLTGVKPRDKQWLLILKLTRPTLLTEVVDMHEMMPGEFIFIIM